MSEIILSVIIPVYNAEKYLSSCLDSILTQPYKDLEVILVDDGSKDSSLKLCLEYTNKDSRVKVYSKENGGASSARNHGLRRASGKYILYCDSDDKWSPDIDISSLIELLENRDSLDFVVFNAYQWTGASGKVRKSQSFPSIAESLDSSKLEKLEGLLSKNILPMAPWEKVIRREFLVANNLLFLEGVTCEDYPWFFSLVEHAIDFCCLNKWFYYHRVDVPGSASRSPKAIENLARVTMLCADYYANSGDTKMGRLILSYLAGQYISVLIHLPKSEKLASLMSDYKWLLKYDTLKKVKLYRGFSSILGVDLTSRIIKRYLSLTSHLRRTCHV